MTSVSTPLHRRQQQCPPADGVTDCLDSATTCIRHGGEECYDVFGSNDTPPWDNCLTHDRDSRPHHDVAFSLAKAQTRHEWCRLLNMLGDQHGLDAASIPIALWVDPNADMHPPGTECDEPDTARASVTIFFSGRFIDGADSRLVSSFVAYTGDFRQSARSTARGKRIVNGSVQVCIDPEEPQTIAATLWGYELGGGGIASELVGITLDRGRNGVTIVLRGPNYRSGLHTDISDDVELGVRIRRDDVPATKCRSQGCKPHMAGSDDIASGQQHHIVEPAGDPRPPAPPQPPKRHRLRHHRTLRPNAFSALATRAR